MTPPPSFPPSRALSPGAQRRIGRKLHRQRKGSHSDALELPERLRDDDEPSPDDQPQAQGPPMFVNMNQSIFGLIAAAGSRIDFNDRFDEESSSSEVGSGDEEPKDGSNSNDEQPSLAKTTYFSRSSSKGEKDKSHRRRISGHKLLKSLPTLPKLKAKSKSAPDKLPAHTEESDSQSSEHSPEQSATPVIQLTRAKTERLPVMSRMLEAQAEMSSRPSFDIDSRTTELAKGSLDNEVSALAHRLMQIFEFDEPEQVVEGEDFPFPSFCFTYPSYEQAKTNDVQNTRVGFYRVYYSKNTVTKSGFLSKCGKHNPKYNRYWFRLKGDVFSYYRDSTNVYFPHGQIDLAYGISASISDKDKDGTHFDVVTRHRTYNFRADSGPSAKEWVKSIQRVIFRSHNDGDSVKISLPISNVIDIEETHMMEFADTCKIKFIDNDETYAIDEYFFSFFSFGREAISVLKLLAEDSNNKRGDKEKRDVPPESKHASPGGSLHLDTARIPRPTEPVKATLSPMSPQSPGLSPRSSADVSRRGSRDGLRQMGHGGMEMSGMLYEDNRRRSFSGSRSLSRLRHDENRTPQNNTSPPESSYVRSSVEDPSYSNIAASTEDASASQILQDSGVFHQSPMSRKSSDFTRLRASHDQLPPLNTDPENSTGQASPNKSAQQPVTPTLQSITKMGTYPLQRAGAFADYLNKTRQRMGTLLATESMGYMEKVSGMWKGGGKHYDEPAGLRVDDDDDFEQDAEGKLQLSMDRFRAHFALPEGEKLQATYFGYILRVLPLYGKIYISDRHFCFRSLLPGTRTKLILPLQDIENVDKEKGFRFGYSGLVVVIRGHEEIFFEFGQAEVRDDCTITLLKSLESIRALREAGLLNQEEEDDDDHAMAERDALKSAREGEFPSHELQMPRHNSTVSNAPTILLDESDASFLNFKPQQSMRITCLTIGSRGDVQPYIALCKGLMADGHKVRIATHGEFKSWVESHGIEFKPVGGDPAELMRLCIENGTFTWAFLREANNTFRGWLDDLLDSAYAACEGSDLLIESPSAMAGIHIAERLNIPYFRAFTMPWTRTRAYPHAFIMPEHKMGGAYNYMTYIMFDNIFWKAIAHQINKWRNNQLGLPSTSLEKMQPNKVPFLYNFSPSVVAPPLDFSDWIRVTGYWFLDEGAGDTYEPPKELADFIQKARDDGKKIVYVGFGSIIVNDPAKMTQEVIDAVLKSDVRCILSKGWSDRASSAPGEELAQPAPEEPEMPPEIFTIKSAPHDWLFKQIDAAAHHGGSGTTGASLRAGIPTIIRPFFGDQFFFATRVEDLGVGVWVKKWGTNAFGRALWEATRNERIIAKARVLGEQIRSENGVGAAIQCIYRDLDYAASLISRKVGKANDGQDAEEEDEESWTFVGGDEPDPDLVTKRLSEGLPLRALDVNKGKTTLGSMPEKDEV